MRIRNPRIYEEGTFCLIGEVEERRRKKSSDDVRRSESSDGYDSDEMTLIKERIDEMMER